MRALQNGYILVMIVHSWSHFMQQPTALNDGEVKSKLKQ